MLEALGFGTHGTHYGEVTRNMVETSDWLSPFWGFAPKLGQSPLRESPFPKPIFLFWSESFTSRLMGYPTEYSAAHRTASNVCPSLARSCPIPYLQSFY